MKHIAVCLLPVLLCLSSCSHVDPLDGTWKSDRELTGDAIRRSGDGRKLPGQGADLLVDTDATLTFAAGRATIDSPGMATVQAAFSYAVVSSDSRSVTISLPDAGPDSRKTDTFHFEGDDVMWTQNENQIQLLPIGIGNYRQYYRRQR